MTTFGVVTRIPPKGDPGNLATALGDVFLDPQATGGKYDDPRRPLGEALGDPVIELYVQVPVFRLGELLIIGGDDRDQFGHKPSKWDVIVEEFTDIGEAVACVSRIKADLDEALLDDYEETNGG